MPTNAHHQYLSLGLDFLNLDNWIQSEVLTILLVHLAVQPDHGVVHLLLHLSHLLLIKVTVLLILLRETHSIRETRFTFNIYDIKRIRQSAAAPDLVTFAL